MATAKQVNFALGLLGRAGYSTRYMSKEYKDFGATMRERSGTVEDWLRKMNTMQCTDLITRLQAMQPEPAYKASEDPEVQALKDSAGEDRDVNGVAAYGRTGIDLCPALPLTPVRSPRRAQASWVVPGAG